MKDFEHEELLNNVILEYEGQLIKIALSYVKDIYAAEDIVQQVWIKYYVRLMERGANSEQSTYAWLYRVTVNQSLDFLRRYYNRNVMCMDKIEILAHVQLDSLRYYEEDELGVWDKEEIYQWVHSLPLKYSKVIMYFYFDDLSYNEIATRLHIPLSTVKSRIHQAKILMRKIHK
ncbi:sigma-70 family RNA polymerase sigma factor [Priestia aryabhattai]|uniref:RNA polymerase sigma factor n=1 Tax=Priestia aryabhattai TaxID=412384 RepID=UPI001CD41621|nr:sigma-70 family RNA polymerase sigma factor [Priestia aryabhattai]MCA1052892.1 sigma-70 family RNA polymerase sigma factor [Priestia aryabhattai]MDT0149828.1 sigma-70 family RNA polymerase sigma factor [Priestia aryabhattai]MDT0155381.1 sigma-70 family RNA polymerase sigma factor [Priestia aryabhattai]